MLLIYHKTPDPTQPNPSHMGSLGAGMVRMELDGRLRRGLKIDGMRPVMGAGMELV